MKKAFVLLSMFLFAFILVSCERKANQHTVTFDSQGGTEVESQIVVDGQFAQEPTAPEKVGFDFVEWTLNDQAFNFFETPITESITLVAVWKTQEVIKDKHVVKFVTHTDIPISDQHIEDGQLATEPAAPTKDGFNFLGWYLNDALYAFTTPVIDSITLEAKWTKIEEPPVYYTIEFNSDGGSEVTAVEVLEGTKLNAPEAPIKAGYDFVGWFMDDVAFDFNTLIQSNITLKARWAESEMVELSYLDGLIAIAGFEKQLLFHEKYQASIIMTDSEYSQAIEAKVDLNEDITLRNSYVLVHENDELAYELYILDGKLYFSGGDGVAYKTRDVITDQLLGNLIGMSHVVATPNAIFKDILSNIDENSIFDFVNASTLKVFKQGHHHFVQLKYNEQNAPDFIKALIAIESDFDLDIKIGVTSNKITSIDIAWIIDEINAIKIHVEMKDYDLDFTQTINKDRFEYFEEEPYVLRVHYGVDDVIQEFSFDENLNCIYEIMGYQMLDFSLEGHKLKGYYYDEAHTLPIDDALQGRLLQDKVVDIYIAWEPLTQFLDNIERFGDANSFFSLETFETPYDDLYGIYKLKEYMAVVKVYHNFDGFAVVYNMELDETYLVYNDRGQYYAMKYDNFDEIVQLTNDLMSLKKEDFMKLLDTHIHRSLDISVYDNQLAFGWGAYNLNRSLYYMHDYTEDDFMVYYDLINDIITSELIETNVDIAYLDVRSQYQYYDYDLHQSVMVLDKDHISDEIHMYIRYMNGITINTKLSQLDTDKFKLIYEPTNDLAPVFVQLLFDDKVVSQFYAVMFDRQIHGPIIIDQNLYSVADYIKSLYVPDYLDINRLFINYKYIEDVNNLDDLIHILETLEAGVNQIEINYTLKSYDYFIDMLNKTDVIKLLYYDEVEVYYSLLEDAFYSDDFIFSFNNNEVTFQYQDFSITVPLKDFDSVSFAESIPDDIYYITGGLLIDNLISLRNIFQQEVIGQLPENYDYVYQFSDNDIFNLTHEGVLTYKGYSIIFTDEIVNLPTIENDGRLIEVETNIEDFMIYIKINLDRIDYGFLTYAPIDYGIDQSLINGDELAIYYGYFNDQMTDFKIVYKKAVIDYIEIAYNQTYYHPIEDIEYMLVKKDELFKDLYLIIVNTINQHKKVSLNQLEDFTYELIPRFGHIHELIIYYQEHTTSTYVYIHDYETQGQLLVVQNQLFTIESLRDAKLSEFGIIKSYYVNGYGEEFETIEQLEIFLESVGDVMLYIEPRQVIVSDDVIIDIFREKIIQFEIYGTDYYFDYQNLSLSSERYVVQMTKDFVRFETVDFKYIIPIDMFRFEDLLNNFHESDQRALELFKELINFARGHYKLISSDDRVKSFEYENSLLDFELYSELQLYSNFIVTKLYSMTAKEIPSFDFEDKNYAYKLHNNINDYVIDVSLNYFHDIYFYFKGFILEGIYDNENFEGEPIYDFIDQENLYLKYGENKPAWFDVYTSNDYLNAEDVTSFIEVYIAYYDGTSDYVLFDTLDASLWTIEVDVADDIISSTITVSYGEMSQTINVPIYDKTVGRLVQQNDIEGRFIYYYLHDYEDYLFDFLDIEKIEASGHGNFDDFESLIDYMESEDVSEISLYIYYNLSDATQYLESLRSNITKFKVNNGQVIYYNHEQKIIYSNDYIYKIDENHIEYITNYLHIIMPKTSYNQIDFIYLSGLYDVEYIKYILEYIDIVFEEMYRDTITQHEGKLKIQTKYNIYRFHPYENGHRVNASEAIFNIELLSDHEMIPMEVRGYTYTFSNNINSDTFEIKAYDGFWFDYALPGYFVSSLTLENGELIEGSLPSEDAHIFIEYKHITPEYMYIHVGGDYFDEVSFFNNAMVFVEFINKDSYASKEILLSDLDPMSYEITLIDEEDDGYMLFRRYELQLLNYPSSYELMFSMYKV